VRMGNVAGVAAARPPAIARPSQCPTTPPPSHAASTLSHTSILPTTSLAALALQVRGGVWFKKGCLCPRCGAIS
jgi:hypothetical protein